MSSSPTMYTVDEPRRIYRNKTNNKCAIYYRFIENNTILIDVFECFQPTISTDIVPRSHGEGRRMMKNFLIYIKKHHPQYDKVMLYPFAYTHDSVKADSSYIENRRMYNKKLINYYKSLGYQEEELYDDEVMIGC